MQRRHAASSTSARALFLGVFCCALTTLAAGACANPQLSSAAKPHQGVTPRPSAAPAPPPLDPALTSPASLPPPPVLEGCATALPLELDVEPLLAALAGACAPTMQPLAASPLVLSLGPGGIGSLPFDVTDPSRCLRAGATGSRGISELELEVQGHDGRVLGADRLRGPVALANPDGPICVGSAGSYRAVLHVAQGSGRVALQVWQAR